MMSALYRRVLALAACAFTLFVIFRVSTSPSTTPAFGSARGSLADAARQQPNVPLSTNQADRALAAARPNNAQGRVGRPQKPLVELADKPLKEKLNHFFPYDVQVKFPAYLWQTWKYTPSSGKFREEYRPLEASWSELHPGFVHEVVTDDVALNIIRHLFSAVPEVIAAYEALPRAVLKADFFRYLILLARGGIYSDIDTQAIKSAVDWVPSTLPRSEYGLVIGIEADPDREDWADWYSRRIQFCQWTIQAKPGHPVLKEVVAGITETVLQKKRDHSLLSPELQSHIVDLTGPAIWTDTIMAFFNDPHYFNVVPGGNNITWRDFTGITSAKKVGDVVVLPITCFSPGIKTMNAGEDDDPMAFVKHYFDGTWKPENERHIGAIFE